MLSHQELFAFLVECQVEGAAGLTVDYVSFIGNSLTCNQLLDKNTGNNMANALAEGMSMSPHVQKFAMKCRVAVTDLISGNMTAEQHVMGLRGPDWCHFHQACNVHIAARVHSRTFSFVEPTISSGLSLSLTLSTGTMMTRFRAAMVQVVKERLVITRQRPSSEAMDYKQCVLALFCSKGPRFLERQRLLLDVVSGDWRLQEVVQIYIPPGIEADHQTVESNLVEALMSALTRRNFHIYPRHRWLGADLAWDDIGLCESVHGLCRATFLKLCSPSRGRGSPAASGSAFPLPASEIAAVGEELAVNPPGEGAGEGDMVCRDTLPGSSISIGSPQPAATAGSCDMACKQAPGNHHVHSSLSEAFDQSSGFPPGQVRTSMGASTKSC